METDEVAGHSVGRHEQGTLREILTELARRVPPAHRAGADDLVHRLDRGRLRVVVIGEAKRGKSTLVNALLGRQVLPTGVVPVTAVITRVVFGQHEGLDVELLDGTRRECELAELASLVTEVANPSNWSGVASVAVRLNLPLLATGIELVDTPGTGSVFAHNTASAQVAMGSMDVAVLVLTADAPLSSAERELLVAAARGSIRVFCLLNKVDYLTDSNRQEALGFITRNIQEAVGQPVPVFACSARDFADPGLRAFRAALLSEVEPTRDLSASITSTAVRLTASALDSVAVATAALTAEDDRSLKQLERFRDRLAVTTRKSAQVSDVVAALSGGLLREVNDASTLAAARLRKRIDDHLTVCFAADLAETRSSHLEDEARALLAAELRPGLDEWRESGRLTLIGGLDAISERLTLDLEADLRDVRDAARELLGIDLALQVAAVALPDDSRFFYTLAPEPAQSELTARAVRRHLPGSLGRRRIEARVRADARRLADAQVGRVRADLQARLGAASRALARRCAEQYFDSVAQLGEAIDLAAASHGGAHDEIAETLTNLESDRAALMRILETLNAVEANPSSEGHRHDRDPCAGRGVPSCPGDDECS